MRFEPLKSSVLILPLLLILQSPGFIVAETSPGQGDTHWSFSPPRRPALPALHDPTWPRNAVDHFVLRRLEAEGLRPSPEARRETLIRRLSLDLTGLPPTPKEVEAFLSDAKPVAYERLVDRLLASPRFGERRAMDWLDLARFADTDGYSGDQERSMWLWRDWVIDALNEGMPFDRFTIEQLAGDLLPDATLAQRIATGFNRNHRINREPGTIPEEWRVEYVVDRVDTTSTVWLGLTVICARCHSHKYDPISQREFYELFAFFNNVDEVGNGGEKTNAPPVLRLSTEEEKIKLAEIDQRIRAARKAYEDLKSSTEAEKDAAQTAKKELDRVKKERLTFLEPIPSTMVMADRAEPRATFVLDRGLYNKAGERVEPGVPARLSPFPSDASRDRLGLARWLTSPDNPLTARVTVNRYWQSYFGIGLVRTDEDFGTRGESPSHPELLDWLASEFAESGWNVKAMHRALVTSATYRQASRLSPELLKRDPENRLLARASRLRLPAEIIRDQALLLGGLLVDRIGGPSVKPFQPPGVWDGVAYRVKYVPDEGANRYRRSLYTYWKRTVPPPAMTTFDAPDRETCKTRRARTNTPLQALVLLNGETYTEAARCLAEAVLTRPGLSPSERLEHAFRRVLARLPESEERKILLDALNRYLKIYASDQKAAEELSSIGKSNFDQALDVSELAAYTAVSSVLLNLDKTITRE